MPVRSQHTVSIALAAMTLVGTGCSIAPQTEATVVGPAPDIRQLTADRDTDPPPPLDDRAAPRPDDDTDMHPPPTDPAIDRIVLVGPDGDLVVAERTATSGQTGSLRALETLLHDPLTDAEREQQLTTAIPPGSRVIAWAVEPDMVGVMLSPEFDVGGTETQIEQRILQVVCTVGLAVEAGQIEVVVGQPDGSDGRPIAIRGIGGCPLP